MKKISVFLAGLALTSAMAQSPGRLKEAMDIYYKGGATQLMKEINTGSLKAGADGFLVVMDPGGKALAHGEGTKFVGVNLSNLKDTSGRTFVKEILEKGGKGKISISWNRTGSVVNRTYTWEQSGDLIFCWVADQN